MTFNSKKFQTIRLAEIISDPHYMNDDGDIIEPANLVKDLGIHIASDMKFDQHIRIIATRGRRTSGWITRIFNTRSPGVMLTLLKQLIYPTIEYNSVLWSPHQLELINLLESIQSNFLKKIKSPRIPPNSDYWDLLRHFKLYSMQRRRERYSQHLSQPWTPTQQHHSRPLHSPQPRNLHRRPPKKRHHCAPPNEPTRLVDQVLCPVQLLRTLQPAPTGTQTTRTK